VLGSVKVGGFGPSQGGDSGGCSGDHGGGGWRQTPSVDGEGAGVFVASLKIGESHRCVVVVVVVVVVVEVMLIW
jgi:hypothetical protein